MVSKKLVSKNFPHQKKTHTHTHLLWKPTHHYIYVEVVSKWAPFPKKTHRFSPGHASPHEYLPASQGNSMTRHPLSFPRENWKHPKSLRYLGRKDWQNQCVWFIFAFWVFVCLFLSHVIFVFGAFSGWGSEASKKGGVRWHKMVQDGTKMVNLPLVSVKVTGPAQVDIETNRIYLSVGVGHSNKKLWMISWQWQFCGKDWGHVWKPSRHIVHHIFQGWGNWRCVYGGVYGIPLTMVKKKKTATSWGVKWPSTGVGRSRICRIIGKNSLKMVE